MKMYELMEELEVLAPKHLALSWDNVGLLIGDAAGVVTKSYLSLDVDSRAIAAAKEAGCDLILSHHPFVFSAV